MKLNPHVIIYNLFPPLAGKIAQWNQLLKGIVNMGFTWIYINPINQRGFSGSLYSIKDYFRLDPKFAIDQKDQETWNSFKAFIVQAHSLGLQVIFDIVINHTAIDSVSNHPHWYLHKWILREKKTLHPVWVFEEIQKKDVDYDRNQFPSEKYELVYTIAPPYAVNPANTNEMQIWGDLAEINFDSPYREEITSFFKKYLAFCINFGVDGFRADAAYQVPADIWKELISFCKNIKPDIVFWAETLGANFQQNMSLKDVKFDFIANSSKWWDFTASWCLEQQKLYSQIAPSISFPESHDTTRLVKETGGRKDVQIFRYFFAAYFSKGVLMPIGYEWGEKKQLKVVFTEFIEKSQPLFDIRKDIQRINQFKSKYPLLQQEGLLWHYPYENLGILILRKRNTSNNSQMLLIYNKDWFNAQLVQLNDLTKILDFSTPIYQFDSQFNLKEIREQKLYTWLPPNQYLLYYQTLDLKISFAVKFQQRII
ncbi:MAG: hypothetical protein K9W44_05750 [Candidatus Lokiarchaeota archaeon]|nr:hypothetical protein [Candidatus Harpocratesius repetitus]